ncbi:hypothetical protein AMIS_36350 [Actinoplanes missouriensis 431]|uniref:Uncharacterized protein n=1 Tax=Actinoplanes missouriensis (strain ATCC 14538 / DSM 43046 / CBS 188.64 / JCM 3121 / NBRC 102363 / NCIMB 12654 / NRRL B-3342 / UNCC 431) TaxID=512565 RepID=I0H768_ACTM4|nr:hypothetical protein [Actinoplanes missouriensis]BAL88855.1 hypothetical protein AMIS_36350 [Actinoplanes missouriensis 431]
MNDEQLIKDAYEAIAGTAVSPERVRARLNARVTAHRQRRLLLAGAGVATVAVAVGVPVALRERRGEPALPVASPSVKTSPRTARRVSLLFTPQWLPDGLVERFRSVKFDVATGKPLGGNRSWYPTGSPYTVEVPKGSVSFSVGERIDDGSGEPVMVGSVRGTLRVTDSAWVEWQPTGKPSMIVSVYGTADDTEIALRVARSVAATEETMLVTMDVPEVPDAFAGSATFEVNPTGEGTGVQTLGYTSADLRSGFQLTTDAPQPNQTYLSVERDGMTVYLLGEEPGVVGSGLTLSETESRNIIYRVTFRPPDVSWAGF